MSKKVIAIIFGGRSSEHEISCVSAGGVLAALDKSKYEVVLIGITRSGKWVHVSENFPLEIRGGVLPEVPADAPAVVADVHGLSVNNKSLNVDVIFRCCTGRMVKMEQFKAFARWPILLTLAAEFLLAL